MASAENSQLGQHGGKRRGRRSSEMLRQVRLLGLLLVRVRRGRAHARAAYALGVLLHLLVPKHHLRLLFVVVVLLLGVRRRNTCFGGE